MKLVQVIPHRRMGGMQEVAYALDSGLPGHGIDAELLDLEEVVARHPGRMALPRALADLVRSWRREHPDAVMAHTMKNAVFSLTAARAAAVARRIVVVHASRESLGEPRVRMLQGLCAAGIATDVVFVGQSAANSYRELPAAVLHRSRVIVNGVRLDPVAADAPQPRELGPRDTARLVVAGRLDAGKNVATLLRAVSALKQPTVLDVYGDGEERAELEALAGELGVRAAFHGAVPRQQLPVIYRGADLFCFPSLAEGLPLALVEVAAAGLAVVSSDLPSTREVLGEGALYCVAIDVGAWQAAIQRCLSDVELRRRIAEQAASRAPLFDVERMVANYAAMLTLTGAP